MSNSTITRTRTVVREIQVRTCACSTIKAEVGEADLPKKIQRYIGKDGVLTTGCKAETTGTWAPGHDAKAVSILGALQRAGIKAEIAPDVITDALQAKIDYVPERTEKPMVAIRLADGTEVEARIGRDGKARTADGDVHKPGTFLLV